MALKPCCSPGCPALTKHRFCDQHQKENRQQSDQRRGSSSERGYGYKWQKYRRWFLSKPENALCRNHLKQGAVVLATVVDHIVPHKGDYKLFWDSENHQGLCKVCHDIKTATEDGGFGRVGG